MTTYYENEYTSPNGQKWLSNCRYPTYTTAKEIGSKRDNFVRVVQVSDAVEVNEPVFDMGFFQKAAGLR